MKSIQLAAKGISPLIAELYEDKSPKTCAAIWDALPLTIDLSRWGDELYGTLPFQVDSESPRDVFELGELAYWLEGSSFCILFGKTPVSKKNEPRTISPCNPIGKIKGDVSIFKKFQSLRLTISQI